MLGKTASKSVRLRRRIVAQSMLFGTLLSAKGAKGALPGTEVRALISGSTEPVRPFIEAFGLRQRNFYYDSNLRNLVARRGSAIYLALGPVSLSTLLEANVDGPIVSVFVASQTYKQMLSGATANRTKQITGVFAECSPDSQLELAYALFQRRISVGVLLSSITAGSENLIRQAAQKHNIELTTHVVSANANPVRELNRLADVTAILAIPDAMIFNSQTLRGLLESTYRRGQGIIGFSTSMVMAGTLATAYAAVDDVAAQVDEVVQFIGRERIPESQYPYYWRVEVNKQVARSLNIIVSDGVLALGSRPKAR